MPSSTTSPFFLALRKIRNVSPVTAGVVALLVTTAVSVPFAMRALGHSAPATDPIFVEAEAGHLVFSESDAGSFQILDGAELQGEVFVSYQDEQADVCAFQLFQSGSAQRLLASQDSRGPRFDLISDSQDKDRAAPLDTRLLPDGKYELFMTATNGTKQGRTAVVFSVANGTKG